MLSTAALKLCINKVTELQVAAMGSAKERFISGIISNVDDESVVIRGIEYYEFRERANTPPIHVGGDNEWLIIPRTAIMSATINDPPQTAIKPRLVWLTLHTCAKCGQLLIASWNKDIKQYMFYCSNHTCENHKARPETELKNPEFAEQR